MRLKLPRVREGLKEERLRTRGKDRDQEEKRDRDPERGNTDLKTERARDQRAGKSSRRQRFSVGQGETQGKKMPGAGRGRLPQVTVPIWERCGWGMGLSGAVHRESNVTASHLPQACPSVPSGPRSWPSQGVLTMGLPSWAVWGP